MVVTCSGKEFIGFRFYGVGLVQEALYKCESLYGMMRGVTYSLFVGGKASIVEDVFAFVIAVRWGSVIPILWGI